MPSGGQPGIKYCPHCRLRVDTNVITGSQANVVWHGIEAKRREITCTRCRNKWHTLEVIESDLDGLVGGDQ